MDGRRYLSKTLYLQELNFTLDVFSIELGVPLLHFEKIPDHPSLESIVPEGEDSQYLAYYLRAEKIMLSHFELSPI